MADDPTPPAELLEALLADAGELAAMLEPTAGSAPSTPPGAASSACAADGPAAGGLGFDLVAEVDRPVLEVDLLPALAARGAVDRHPQRRHRLRHRGPHALDAARSHPDGAITWIARDISTERAVYERLHRKVFEDELTGLPHRSIFLDRLDLSLRRTHPGAPSVTLLFVGLDRFRERSERLAARASATSCCARSADRLDGLRGRDRQRGAVG